MSRAAADQQADAEVERAVRNTSQFARSTLHRRDEDADEPRPACVESEIGDADGFTEVDPAAYPTYDRLSELCMFR